MTTNWITARQPGGRTNTRGAGRTNGVLLDKLQVTNTRVRYGPFETVFAQGDSCADLMYIQKGRVRLSVASHGGGRRAVLGVLTTGAFFGEGALAGQRRRRATAETMTQSTIAIVQIAEMRRRLHEDSAVSDWFRSRLLAKNNQIEADLVDQLFNGSEKRLARALLLLAHFDQYEAQRLAMPKISRNLIAEMVGTTRSKVDVLMNEFRKLGFLEVHSERDGGLHVHCSMLSVLLRD